MNRRSTALYDNPGTADYRRPHRFMIGFRGFAPLLLYRVSLGWNRRVATAGGNYNNMK